MIERISSDEWFCLLNIDVSKFFIWYMFFMGFKYFDWIKFDFVYGICIRNVIVKVLLYCWYFGYCLLSYRDGLVCVDYIILFLCDYVF